MKQLFTLLIVGAALVAPVTVFAQSNYHEGFVVKANGDTTRGYIDSREWSNNPKIIAFKANKNDTHALKFDPSTIIGFEIIGVDTYTSYIGPISTDRTSFPDLPPDLDTSKKQDTIFLKQVATGNYLTLFYHSDAIKTRFFIAEKNNLPVELKYYQYYNNVEQVVATDVFKGQLLLYANKFAPGNNRLTGKIEAAKYDQKDLPLIVDEINSNKTPVKRKPLDRLFVSAAINYTKIVANDLDVDNPNANGPETATVVAPKVSIGFDFSDNPNIQRFIFKGELSFSYLSPQFLSPATISNTHTNVVYEYNQYTSAVIPQLLYNVYNKDDFKVFIAIGISFNFSFYSNNKLTIQSTDPNLLNAYTYNKPYELVSAWVTAPVQAGVTLNRKISIYFSYDVPFTGYLPFSSSTQSMNLGVRYLFGEN